MRTINHLEYIVITPVRDEAANLQKTIDSMVFQTLLPKKWIIVNDGSTDNTAKIITSAAKKFKWICIVNRHNRGYRKPGGGVINAFYDGYAKINNTSWDFLVKLDGDLSFGEDYFEKCLSIFEHNKKLGIAGGTIYRLKNGKFIVDSPYDPKFHVRGATKIYRYECWQHIKPLVRAPGWDTIDEIKANMNGWLTVTFPDLMLIQHKATGSADGSWNNWFKNGRANYVTGYHPLFMIAKCAKRALKRPAILGSLALLAGYITGYFKKEQRVDDSDLIHFLRKEQIKKILFKKSIYT